MPDPIALPSADDIRREIAAEDDRLKDYKAGHSKRVGLLKKILKALSSGEQWQTTESNNGPAPGAPPAYASPAPPPKKP